MMNSPLSYLLSPIDLVLWLQPFHDPAVRYLGSQIDGANTVIS